MGLHSKALVLSLIVLFLMATIAHSGASCIIQKAETSIRVSEYYDEDTGQLAVSARLTYTNLDTGKTEGLGQQELEFIVNYTTSEGEKSDKFKMQTDTRGWATVNFVIPGAIKHTATVIYKGNDAFKESIGTVGGSARSSTSFETGLPQDINLVACLPLLILVGFLGAAMYASGRNPFGVVDFTAPRGITTQRRVMKAFQAGWVAQIFAISGGVVGAIATSMVGAKAIPRESEKEKGKEEASKQKGEEQKGGHVKGAVGDLEAKPKKKEPEPQQTKPPVPATPTEQASKSNVVIRDAEKLSQVTLPKIVHTVSGFGATLGIIGVILSVLGGNVWAAMGIKKEKVYTKDKDGKEVVVERIVTKPMAENMVRKVHALAKEEKAKFGSISKEGDSLVLVYDKEGGTWKFTKLSDLKSELENRIKELENAKNKCGKQKEEIEKEIRELKGSIQKIEEKISGLKETAAKHSKELDEKEKAVSSLKKEKEQLEKDKAALEKQIKPPVKGETDDQRKAREKNNAEIQKKINEIEGKLKAAKEKLTIALSEVNALSNKAKESGEMLAKADVELNQAKHKLAMLNNNKDALSDHLKENERDLKKVDAALKDINNTMDANKKVYDKYVKDIREKYGSDLEKAGVKKEDNITPKVIDELIKNAQEDLKSAKTKDEKAAIEKKIDDLKNRKDNLQDANIKSQESNSAAYITSEVVKSNIKESEKSVGRGRFLCNSTAEEVAKADVYSRAEEAAGKEREIAGIKSLVDKADFSLKRDYGEAFVSADNALDALIGVAAKRYGSNSEEVAKLHKLKEELENTGDVRKVINNVEPFVKDEMKNARNNLENVANFAVKLGVGVEPGSVKIRELPPGEEKLARERGEIAPYGVSVERSVPPGGVDSYIKSITDNKDIAQSAKNQNIYLNAGGEDLAINNKKYSDKQLVSANLDEIIKIHNEKDIVNFVEKNPDAAQVLRSTLELESTAGAEDIAKACLNKEKFGTKLEGLASEYDKIAKPPQKSPELDEILAAAAMRDYGGFRVKSPSFDKAVESLKRDAEAKTVGKIVVFKEQQEYYEAKEKYDKAKEEYDNAFNEYEKNKSELLGKWLKEKENNLISASRLLGDAEQEFNDKITKTEGNVLEKIDIMKSDKTLEDWKKARDEYDKSLKNLNNTTYASYLINEKGDKDFYLGGEKENYKQAIAEEKLVERLNSVLTSYPEGIDKLDWLRK
ncbi:MAG: hypothetical protein QXS93_03150 [Candidatus Micrarchaeia archaeon]